MYLQKFKSRDGTMFRFVSEPFEANVNVNLKRWHFGFGIGQQGIALLYFDIDIGPLTFSLEFWR